MKHVSLTKEQKATFTPYSNRGDRFASGEKIVFYFKGQPILSTDLPEGSLGTERLELAKMVGIKEFDDYHFEDSLGKVRLRASEIKSPFPGVEAGEHFGQLHGKRYKEYLENENRSAE